MIIVAICIGLFFIILGFLIKAFPELNSTYRGLSDEDKALVDLELLSNTSKKYLITLGVFTPLAYIIPHFLALETLATYSFMTILFSGIAILILNQQKHIPKGSKTQTKVGLIALLLTFIMVSGLFIYGTSETNVRINNGIIVFTGMYGCQLNISEIESINLSQQKPKIISRLNGFSLGEVHKGKYKLSDGDNCTLLINSIEEPYVYLIMQDHKRYILNLKDKRTTIDFFELLTLSIEELKQKQ